MENNIGIDIFSIIRLRSEGDLQRATEILKARIAEFPEDHMLWYHLGLALEQQGDKLGASTAARTCLSLAPEAHSVSAFAAALLSRTGTVTQGLGSLKNVLNAQPNSSIALYALGELYARTGNISLSLHYVEGAVQIAPGVLGFSRLAELYRSIGRESDSERALRQLLAANSEYLLGFLELALCLIRQGRKDESLEYLNELLRRIQNAPPNKKEAQDLNRLEEHVRGILATLYP